MSDASLRQGTQAENQKLMGKRFWAVLGMVLVAAVLRCLPHLPNFSPVTAMALFAGAYFTRSSWAVLIPLSAMFLSDLVLGFHNQVPAVYGSFILVTLLGFVLRSKRSVGRIATATVAGSVLFFVITNFSVWADGAIYPRTLNGLSECYLAALPFLQNSMAGDLVYSAAIFGAFALFESVVTYQKDTIYGR